MPAGWLNAGPTLNYYPTPDRSGPVGFVRKEVRLDFAWPAGHQPGGSSSPDFAAIPADGWSCQSAAGLDGFLSDVSETFTFTAVVSGDFELLGSTDGITYGTTVIGSSSGTTRTVTGTVAITRGVPYYLKPLYSPPNGDKQFTLKRSSASYPIAVIEPIVFLGDQIQTHRELYSNQTIWSRANLGPLDSNGWPTGDGETIYQETERVGLDTDPLRDGKNAYRFLGNKPSTTATGNANTTTVNFNGTYTLGTFNVFNNGSGSSILNTSGGSGGASLIDIQGPTTPGGSTTYPFGQLLDPNVKAAQRNYSLWRRQGIQSSEKDWSDRTLPTYAYQFNEDSGGIPQTATPLDFQLRPSVTQTPNITSFELDIQTANEAGVDLLISWPVQATDTYLTNMVNVFAFGSDSSGTPYTSVQTTPFNPPLNPNLHVIFEMANELWNVAFPFLVSWWYVQRAADLAKANSTAFGVLLDSDSGKRKLQWALGQTARLGEIIANLLGGPEPGNRFGTYFGYQYADFNNTADIPFNWLVKGLKTNPTGFAAAGITATRVNQRITHTGAATYWGAGNTYGLTALAPDPTFLVPTVSGFHIAPGGSPNTFAGNAGMVDGSSIAIAPPGSQTQVSFIPPGGRITVPFTVPAGQVSPYYAMFFQAMNQTGTLGKLRAYIDFGTGSQQEINYRSAVQTDGYVPAEVGAISPWGALVSGNILSDGYTTDEVLLTAGTSHTLSLVADGGPTSGPFTNTSDLVLVANMFVTSRDAIDETFGFAGGGGAAGQPGGSTLATNLPTQVSWAAAMGCEYLAYEGGPGFGDAGGTPQQNGYRYFDSRATAAMVLTTSAVWAMGGKYQVLFYNQQSSWEDSTATQGYLPSPGWGTQPLPAGIIQYINQLPPSINFDYTLPSLLKMDGIAKDTSTDGYLSAVFAVLVAGTYDITGANLGGGTIQLDGGSTTIASNKAFLTIGQHSAVVNAASGQSPSSTATVAIVLDGAPSSAPTGPTLAGTVLSWGGVGGATGYAVRWGTTSGRYPNSLAVAGTSADMASFFTQGQIYYVAVAAVNSSGQGLPGTEKQVLFIVPNVENTNGQWDTTTPPTTANTLPMNLLTNSGVGVSAVVCSYAEPGVDPSFYGRLNGMIAIRDQSDSTHASAYANGNKYSLTITPPGSGYSPKKLKITFFQQDNAGVATGQLRANGSVLGTSGATGGSGLLSYTFDLSGMGIVSSPQLLELTIAPGGIFTTSAFGASLSDPTTLQLTGVVSVPYQSPSKLAATVAGFM